MRNNNERVFNNKQFSQNVCVTKEVGVPINELVSKKYELLKTSGFIIIVSFYKIDVRYSKI